MAQRLQNYCLPEELKSELTRNHFRPCWPGRKFSLKSTERALLLGPQSWARALLSNASQRKDLLSDRGQHSVPPRQAEFGYHNLYRWNK